MQIPISLETLLVAEEATLSARKHLSNQVSCMLALLSLLVPHTNFFVTVEEVCLLEFGLFFLRTLSLSTRCEREECAFMSVLPTDRFDMPKASFSSTSSGVSMGIVVRLFMMMPSTKRHAKCEQDHRVRNADA